MKKPLRRGRMSSPESKVKTLHVRMSAEEYNRLVMYAAALHLTVSQYVRAIIENDNEK